MENNLLLLCDSSIDSFIGIWKICQIAHDETFNIYVLFKTPENKEVFFDTSPEYSIEPGIYFNKSVCYFLNEDEFYEEFYDVKFDHVLEYTNIPLNKDISFDIYWNSFSSLSTKPFEGIPLSYKNKINFNLVSTSMQTSKNFYEHYRKKNSYCNDTKTYF